MRINPHKLITEPPLPDPTQHPTTCQKPPETDRSVGSFGKRGLLEKGSFQKTINFLEILENLEIVEILENPQTLENKGESDHFLEILEILENLEILEIPLS